MRLFRPSFFVLFLLLAQVFHSFAQTGGGSVTGKLADTKSAPVSYATVTLLRTDSSVVSGDLTKEDGTFAIQGVPAGTFRLRVEAMGYNTKFVNVELTAAANEKNVGTIKLSASEQSLNEVSVVGEKPIMELKVDKKVFNVEKNTTTAGGSAADVLQNVPAVSVDADGTVSLRGKTGVTILIDGKPATMLGTDVASALQSLPAGSIENVEVITNPSGKYDAQGTSGIINIVTKKDKRAGFNGNITVGAGTRDKYNGSLGLNWRKDKWNVFLNSSYRLNNTFNNVTTNRVDKQNPDSPAVVRNSYHTYEHVPRRFDGFFNTIGASFDPDKNNSFTFTENINLMEFGFKDMSDFSVYDNPTESGTPVLSQYRYSRFVGSPTSLSSSLDYKHKFKKKDEELTMNATYAATLFKRTQEFYTRTAGADTISQHAPGTGTNDNLTIFADYVNPLFTKNGKLGMGVKTQLFWFTSDAQPTRSVNGGAPVADATLLSVFNYTQQIHAAYVNWNDQLGKFSYMVSLRAEDAVYDGSGKTPRDTSLHNSFLSLFPSAFISYQLKNQQSMYLNYSRRTNRPGFMQLLPFIDLSNPSTVNTGNPALIPEFINNFELSYSKADNRGDNFILSAYYAYTQNLIERVTRGVSPQEAASYNVLTTSRFTQPVNIASGTTYGLEGTGHVQIVPAWDATVNLNFFQNELVIGSRDPLVAQNLANRSGFTWFGKVNSNLKLPKNFSLQLNANYESPKVIAQGSLKESFWMDLALKKTLWKNKATLVVNCSDVLKTRVFVTYYDQIDNNQVINRVKETRIGNITFTYRFGKQGNANAGVGKRRGGGDDKPKAPRPSEEDRAKNMKENDEGDQGGGQGGPGGGGRKQGQ